MKRLVLFCQIFAAAVLCSQEPVFYPVETSRPGEWFLRSIESGRAKYEKHYLDRLDKLAPQAARRRFAEDFHRMLDEQAVSNREEDAAIETALKWNPGDFTFHNHRFYWKTGCTSWMVAPDASATGAAMLQKNRDYSGQNLLSVRMYRAMPGRYKIVTVGDLWNTGAGAVMNEKGLMIVQDDGPYWEAVDRRIFTGCTFMLRFLAEQCADAVSAEKLLRKIHAAGVLSSPCIYLIADPDRGFVVETTARHYAAVPVTFGFEARANSFLLPGMTSLSPAARPQAKFLDGENRRFSANEFLGARLRKNGLLSPLDLMACARLRDPEMEKKNWRQVCQARTLASTLMVSDRSYPEVLGAVFIAIGPPRNTVFLPVPFGTTEFPEELANGDMGLLAFAIREKYGLDHDRFPQYAALEKELAEEFFTAREKARILLRQGRRREARKMLTQLFRKQFIRVRTFLKQELETK